MRTTWLVTTCAAWILAAFFTWLSGPTAVVFILVGVLIWWPFTIYKIIPDMCKATMTGDAKKPTAVFAGLGGKLLLVAMFLFPATARQFGSAIYYGYAAGVCAGGGTQFLLMLRARSLSNFPNRPSDGGGGGSARRLRYPGRRGHR